MSESNPSKFLGKKEDVCLPTKQETPPVKVCPTCIPDPNAIEVVWHQNPDPYLDRRKCEYVVRVNINNEGNSYDASQIRDSGKSLKEIIDSYKIAGIYQLLRFFDKEISNQMVFAFPDNPQKLQRMLRDQKANTEQLIEVVTNQLQNGSYDIYGISDAVLQAYNLSNADGFNPEALELYARSDDYYISTYQSPSGGVPIWVKVVIPAFIFDRVPAEQFIEDADDDMSTIKEVVLDGIRLKAQIRRLKHALTVYSKYQAMWWQTEKGKLAFQKDPIMGSYKNSFYCKVYPDKLDSVLDDIEEQIESQTPYKLRSIMTPKSVIKIKITFKSENENNPYYIKKLEVMGASCPDYENIRLNRLKKSDGVKYKAPFNSPTTMGYIAQINDIDSDLNARETPPWLDFLVQYTYPELSLDYGNETAETSVVEAGTSILGCIVDNNGGTEGLRDFFFDQIISTWDSLQYKWNQNACKILAASAAAARGDDEALDKLEKNLSDQNFNDENPNFLEERRNRRFDDAVEEATQTGEEIVRLQALIEKENEKQITLKQDVEIFVGRISHKMQNFADFGYISTFENVSLELKPQDAKNTAEYYNTDVLNFDISELEKVIKQIKESEELVKTSHEEMVFLENSDAKEREKRRREDQRKQTKNAKQEKKAAVRSWESIYDQADKIENKRDLRREQRKQNKEDKQFFKSEAKTRRQNRGSSRGDDPFVKAARDAVLESFDFEGSLISIFLNEEEYASYGLAGISMPDLTRKKGQGAKERLKNFISNFGLCGFSKLLQKAIRCLMAGMDLDTALRTIILSTIKNMSPVGMEKLFLGLDPRKQQEIREQVARTFRDMPAPWERDYNPGRVVTDQQTELQEISGVSDQFKSTQVQIDTKKAEIELLESFLSELKTYLENIASFSEDQSARRLPEGITLQQGSTGQDVTTLQLMLIDLFGPPIPEDNEWTDPGFSADGNFGPKTKIAVEYYQDINFLPVTGIADGATIQTLNPPKDPGDRINSDIISTITAILGKTDDESRILTQFQNELFSAADTKGSSLISSLGKEISDLETKTTALGGEQVAQWNAMSTEEQDKMIEDARSETGIIDISNPDQVQQGSIGKALGNVQKAIFDAYVEAFMSLVGIQDLFAALDKIPGAKLIGRIIASFDCPNVHFIYPPIDSFLSTLTFKQCLDNGRFAFPRIPNLGNIRSLPSIIWQFLKDAFLKALQDLVVRVISAFVLKILLTIENALCKALEAVGRFAAEAVKGPEANFGGLMRDFFCGDDASDGDIDDFTSSLLTSIGVTNDDLDRLAKQTTANDLRNKHLEITKTIARISSRRELEQLIVANDGEQDNNTLNRISSTITLKFPEFEAFFDTPQKVAGIFSSIGNFLTPDQRQSVRENLERPDADLPVDSSICLTNEQFENWNNKRKNLLTNAGLNPEDAQDFVDKLNDQAQDDLGDLADLANQSPEEILGDAIDNGLFPDTGGRLKDPFCDPSGGSIAQLETAESAELAAELADGVFRSLSLAFSNDMIGKKDSLLDNVLADTCNLPLKRHQQRTNNVVFQIDWADSQETWDAKKERFSQTKIGEIYFDVLSGDEPVGVFPDTVGILAKNKLDENEFDVSFKFDVKKKPQINTKNVQRIGLMRDVKVKYKTPYKKDPDLVLDFYNDKDSGVRFEHELCMTSFEDGEAVIKKDLGYKSFIYYYGNEYVPNPDDPDDDGKDMPYDNLEYKLKVNVPTDLSGGALLETHGGISEKSLQELKVPYQGTIFTSYVNSILSGAGHPSLPTKSTSKESYKNYIKHLYSGILKGLNTKLDGSEPEGYNFGYEANNLTPNDLIYVNPEATNNENTWEYTYDNEEMVLGKSATENPRVHFLDPSIYGGSYVNPPIYIEPQNYVGWLGFAQTIVPEFDGCKPRRTDFIGLKELSDNVRKLERAIPIDSRLREDPDCIKHIPFDKISDPSTLAYLDTTIKATIRVYITEAMTKTMPLLAHMKYNSSNYDTGFESLIVERMQDGLDETEARLSIFGGRIQNYNYWLLFLEQAVQSLVRKIDLGEIESNSEIDDARDIINRAQRNFVYPSRDAFKKIRGTSPAILRFTPAGAIANATTDGGIKKVNPSKIQEEYGDQPAVKQILRGLYIAGFGTLAKMGAFIDQEVDLRPTFLTLNGARFASKINTIYNVREAAKTLLKYLVKSELEIMSGELNENLKNPPYIDSYHKYTLALNEVYEGTTLRSGLTEVEAPIVDGEINYGDIPNVGDVDTTALLATGGFYLEKYVRIIDKPQELVASSSFWNNDQDPARPDDINLSVQSIISQRPQSLKGVCNISEFGAYFAQSKDQFDDATNISDIFGDAVTTTTSYEGSTGLKFGVRICMVFDPIMASNIDPSQIDSDVAQREKAFVTSIPIASFEQDIPDIKFKDLKFSDNNLDQDLKCYIDGLAKSEEFLFVMDYVFGIKKVPSLMMMYINESFIEAIGSDVERDLDNTIDRFDDKWKGEILSDSKRICRQLFASFYRSDDFETPERDDGKSLKEILQQFKEGSIFGKTDPSMKWWRRRRLRSRPYDKDGKECAGEFGSLFKN